MVKQIAIKLTFGCDHGLHINHSHVYTYMSLSITVSSNQNWVCVSITCVNTSLIWILVRSYICICYNTGKSALPDRCMMPEGECVSGLKVGHTC